jgi:hypothetical protein
MTAHAITSRFATLSSLVGLSAFAAGSFALCAYNSGYGYDALENLLLAQSLTQGGRFYDLIPSRPCGLYFLLYALAQWGYRSPTARSRSSSPLSWS